MQVLELRERRLDHEETLGEVQKATDEHKRNLDRQARSTFSFGECLAGLLVPSRDPDSRVGADGFCAMVPGGLAFSSAAFSPERVDVR